MSDFITIGELAKRAHVTVRTIQYYDKIDLVKPNTLSEGGRRLYSIHDITILHQIITLKSLGLTLDEIKRRLQPINNNQDISIMLSQQSEIIKEQISKSQKILESIEVIQSDIDGNNEVDWSKYSNMVKLIQENNESFWVLNYLDHEMLNNITKVHEKYSEEELPSDWFVKCMKKAKELLDQGTRPDSVDAQKLAGDMWSMVKKYSNSQPEMIEKLYEFYTNTEHWPEKYSLMQKESQAFLEKSIEYYIGSLMVKENLKERS